MPLTNRQAKIKALDIAHWRVHDASIQFPLAPESDPDPYSDEDHSKISKYLDEIAQQLYNRAESMKERSK